MFFCNEQERSDIQVSPGNSDSMTIFLNYVTNYIFINTLDISGCARALAHPFYDTLINALQSLGSNLLLIG
jgi:hypothetical protein